MADLRYVSYGDSKCKFVFGKNEITKDIDVDDRFIVNHDVVYRVTNNDKTAYDEKSVLVDKNADIDVGSYIYFNDCWWIIVFKEHQSLNAYKKYIMRVCNQIVKYKRNGITYDIPVNIHNMTLNYMVSYYRNIVYENRAKSVITELM